MKIFSRSQEKKINNAKKINNIPGINNSPANAPVMKINTQHFNIKICLALKRGQFTYGVKAKV